MLLFTNNYESKIAEDITASDVTIRINSVDGLPELTAFGDFFYLTLETDDLSKIEVVKVVAFDKSGATVTVERGQEGTTAYDFTAGVSIANCVTASTLRELVRDGWTRITDAVRVDDTHFSSSKPFSIGDRIRCSTASTSNIVSVKAFTPGSVEIRDGIIPAGTVAIDVGIPASSLGNYFDEFYLDEPHINSNNKVISTSEEINQLHTRTVGGSTPVDIVTYKQLIDTAFSSSLPDQAGKTGKYLKTDGASATWEDVFPDQTGKDGNALVTDGVDVSWEPVIKGSDVGVTVAGLDSNQKVPTSQLPESVIGGMTYKGTFTPSSGYPPNPEKGWYYIASSAGPAGGEVYEIGDWAVYNGVSWDKIDNTDKEASTTVKGITRYATDVEAEAHALTTAAVTPKNLTGIYNKLATNHTQFLDTVVPNLISNTNFVGKERKKKAFLNTDVTVQSVDQQSWFQFAATYLTISSEQANKWFGVYNNIGQHIRGTIIGDDLKPYEVYFVSAKDSTLITVALNPMYKLTPANSFTAGQSYKLILSAPSDDVADEETTEVDIAEMFISAGEHAEVFNSPWTSFATTPVVTPTWVGQNITAHDATSITGTGACTAILKMPQNYRGGVALDVCFRGVVSNATSGMIVRLYEYDSAGGQVQALSTEQTFQNGSFTFKERYTISDPTHFAGLRINALQGFKVDSLQLTFGSPSSLSYTHTGDYYEINSGLWLGGVYKSNLLKDCTLTGNILTLPSRYRSNRITSFTAIKSDGYGELLTQGADYTFVDTTNSYDVDISNYVNWGYTSAQDFINNGGLRIGMKKDVDILSFVDNPTGVKRLNDDVWVLGHYYQGFGRYLYQQLIDKQPLGSSGVAIDSIRLKKGYIAPANGNISESPLWAPVHHDLPYNNFPTNTDMVKVLFGVQEAGGKVNLVIYFNQLIHGTDWGDDEVFHICDKRSLMLNGNGVPIFCGCAIIPQDHLLWYGV